MEGVFVDLATCLVAAFLLAFEHKEMFLLVRESHILKLMLASSSPFVLTFGGTLVIGARQMGNILNNQLEYLCRQSVHSSEENEKRESL